MLRMNKITILLSFVFLASCNPELTPEEREERRAELAALDDLEFIYKLDASIPEHIIQNITCDNVRNVSYNANTNSNSSWYERDSSGIFHSNLQYTASCERRNLGTPMAAICITSVNNMPVNVTVSPEQFFEVRSPGLTDTCVYVDQIPSVFSKVVTGEIFSEGNCAHYTQERASRLFLACEK